MPTSSTAASPSTVTVSPDGWSRSRATTPTAVPMSTATAPVAGSRVPAATTA